MSSNAEISTMQKSELYDLLMLKAENEKDGIDTKGLDKLINKKKAVMAAEDVAYVEKIIGELK